jgi:hypothetical protein
MLAKNVAMPKLTIELVPRSCWFSNVRDHVTPKQWDTIRRKTYRDAESHCQVCGGIGDKWPVECHEIWEYQENNLIQKLTGLIALCPNCHRVKHIGYASISGNFEMAKAHLAKVNNWNEDTAQSYINSAFLTWEKRSQQKWKLDLSWLLTNFGIDIVEKR